MTKRLENSPKIRKKIEALYHKIGLRHGYSDEVIKNIIESQYDFIKKTMIKLPFRETNTEEEFNKLKTNFMLRKLGKIYSNYKILEYIKIQVEAANKTNNKLYGRNTELQREDDQETS